MSFLQLGLVGQAIEGIDIIRCASQHLFKNRHGLGSQAQKQKQLGLPAQCQSLKGTQTARRDVELRGY